MARIEVFLPAMGEGVIEATVNKWLVAEGSKVNEDDPIVEVATDKVDSEVPSPASGILTKIIAKEGSVPKVGEIIAIIENEAGYVPQDAARVEREVERIRETIEEVRSEKKQVDEVSSGMKSRTPSGRFLSPLVRSIAAAEGISYEELDTIQATGADGRITRDDVLLWLRSGRETVATAGTATETRVERLPDTKGLQLVRETTPSAASAQGTGQAVTAQPLTGDTVVEMDRVRKLIAEHMTMSKRTSAHVTSYIDADVTRLVNWRNSVKESFLAREGVKLTLTPVFIDAVTRALKDFPMLNSSVDGSRIIMKKNINIGMATALPDGNLIVPVIKNCDEKSLT
ncbi:MAG: 2-oxo acid dehydrogenase subunit E2, partial [Bacteroidetes bacterium]|nr:2-oxo acid dehydrogenase subunit E2 [Bacteroidota bacterium]